jgi:Xaa-Pro aminopeptidase
VPPLAWFDAAEQAARAERARAAMAAAGLDALWLTAEANYIYLSGHQTGMFAIKSRPLSLLLPREGEPALVIARSHLPQAAATSWVSDQRGYDGFEGEAIALLAALARERGLAGARIGAELGHEQRLGVSPLGFDHLRALLPGVEWRDAAPLLWRLRARKSAAEVARLAEAGAATGRAYRAALARAAAGVSERELRAAFVAGAVEAGADRAGFFFVHSGNGAYQPSDGTPTERRLAVGDLLWMDAGAVCRGYWADYTRMAAVGQATPEQRRRYELVFRASRAVLSAVRPGVPVAELARLCAEHLASAGEALGTASRIGHGIGLDLTEPPSLNESDPTRLEPGMALAIEPTIVAPSGRFVVEENLVVTEDGFELLSEPASPELPVVRGQG